MNTSQVNLRPLIAAFAFLPATSFAQSAYLDTSTAGNRATIETSYGEALFVVEPGINVNPAFKVEDMQTNWSKDNLSGFNNSADMTPIPVGDVPIVNLGGINYVGLGFDFNEGGSTKSDFDIVNVMIWSGPGSINTLEAGLEVDPDLSAYSWGGNPSAQVVRSWENNLRVMEPGSAGQALGLTSIYEQNLNPQIFTPGDTRPFDTDPNRLRADSLRTLGSNAVEVAVLVPATVLDQVPADAYIYVGVQTGTLNDGGSDRFGYIDPSTMVVGGYFDTVGAVVTPFSMMTPAIPEPSGSLFLAISAGGLLFRPRRRQR